MSSLFMPGKIGCLELPNRIIMAAMTTNFADEAGHVTHQMLAYYRKRAQGGVGLIIIEATYVALSGKRFKHNLCIFDDSFIPGLRELAAVVKSAGARAAIQLNHGGRESSKAITGIDPIAPSSVASAYSGIGPCGEVPKTATLEEISELIEAFGRAARRAREAGFDAVEIHGAHGYLISEFLSPLTNLRTDAYGGDVAGRTRFYSEVIRRCKELAGKDFPVITRINAHDFMPAGLQLEESLQAASILEKTGADAIHVSVGMHSSRPYMIIPGMFISRACNAEYAKRFKQVLGVPVICVGRINDPGLADEILRDQTADFVCMGRAFIADPDWPRKYQVGRSDIRKCIACNEGCIGRIHKQRSLACSVNPEVGREAELTGGLTPAPDAKRIWVVGGGPAGMEAARVAASRGHDVTLWEKEEGLGGQLNLGVIPPGRVEIGNILGFYQVALRDLGVKVNLCRTLHKEMVEKERPDAVIVATGAKPAIPPIPGAGEYCVLAWDVLAGRTGNIGSPCVIIGAGPTGLETAEFLAEKGCRVGVMDVLTWEELLETYPRAEAVYHQMRMEELDIEFHGGVQVKEIRPHQVLYRQNGWERALTDVNTVILATGSVPADGLARAISDLGVRIVEAGDCQKPGKIIDAVDAGFRAGLSV